MLRRSFLKSIIIGSTGLLFSNKCSSAEEWNDFRKIKPEIGKYFILEYTYKKPVSSRNLHTQLCVLEDKDIIRIFTNYDEKSSTIFHNSSLTIRFDYYYKYCSMLRWKYQKVFCR